MKSVLSLKKALAGLDGLYEPKGKFKFAVAIPAFAPNVPKEKWINHAANLWAQNFEEIDIEIISSNFSVYSIDVEKGCIVSWEDGKYAHKIGCQPYILGNNNYGKHGKIWLDVKIPGSVKTENFDSEMAKSILKNVERRLGEQFRKNFKPPFDTYKPKFMSDCTDVLIVDFYTGLDFFNEIKTRSDDIEKLVTKCLKNKNAEYSSMSFKHSSKFSVSCDVRITIDLIWKKPVDDDERGQLAYEIAEKLEKECCLGYLFFTKFKLS